MRHFRIISLPLVTMSLFLLFFEGFPFSCLFVIVGGKYAHKIRDVMEKVNSITNDNHINKKKPLAVFVISDDYNKNIIIDVEYGFERFKSTPVMVKYIVNLYCFSFISS